jgi:porin
MKNTHRLIFHWSGPLYGIAIVLALAAMPAFGGTAEPAAPTVARNFSTSDLLTRDYLFGDWFGRRTSLEEKGYKFTFNYTADTQRNFSGGLDEQTAFFGRARFILDVDLEKAAGIHGGKLFISALSQDGDLLHQTAGTYTPFSSIAGSDSTRLDQFYYEQTLFNDKVWFRIGQVAGVDEFGMQPYGGYFVNDQLGYVTNLEFNTRIPFNAGAQPGLIVQIGDRKEGAYIKGGVFSGKPDAYANDKHGVDFDIENDSTVYAAEAGYKFGGDMPGDVRIGGHYNDGKFTRLDNGDEVNDNYVIYAMANKTVWQDPGDAKRGIDLGITAFYGPGSRNFATSEILLTAAYRGIIASRPDDFLSLGFIRNEFGDEASDASRNAGFGKLDPEYVVELSYKVQLTPYLFLQPDLQYVINPSGTSRGDIFVAGFRTSINF